MCAWVVNLKNLHRKKEITHKKLHTQTHAQRISLMSAIHALWGNRMPWLHLLNRANKRPSHQAAGGTSSGDAWIACPWIMVDSTCHSGEMPSWLVRPWLLLRCGAHRLQCASLTTPSDGLKEHRKNKQHRKNNPWTTAKVATPGD